MIKEPSTAGRLHYLITMLQTGFTTCEVKFNSHGSVYTYKVKTGMLAVDDKAVVCVDGVFKVVTVLNVHSEPVIDIHQPYILKWIVCKVDDAAYNEQTAREEQAIKQIQDDERKAARANAIAELSSMLNVTELKRILGS